MVAVEEASNEAHNTLLIHSSFLLGKSFSPITYYLSKCLKEIAMQIVAVAEIASRHYLSNSFSDLMIVAPRSYSLVSHRSTNPTDLHHQCTCQVEVLTEWNQCTTVILLTRVAATVVAVTLRLLRPTCNILLNNQLRLNSSNKDKE